MDPFFIYLSESYKALDEIQPLTTNQILFEAEDNEKVAKISNKNEASKEKSDNMFMKALAKLRALIDKVIDSIKNFIDYMGLSKDQKALYKDFREKVKNNPEFRNKKVTVKVYEGIQESYGNALKNAEATYKNIKDEESGARNEEIAKTLDKAKENVNYVEKSVTLAALCKMIDQNEALARNIESAILIDRMTLNKLEQTYGKKGAKKIEDHIYVKTHKIGILKLGARGIIMKARQKEVEYVGDTLKELTKDIPSLLSAANAIDKDKTKALTRIAMRTAMDVGGDSVAQGAGGPIKRFAKKQVTQKGPVGFVRRKYHEKFDRKENIADDIEGAKSYLRLRRESVDGLDLYDDLFNEGVNMNYHSQLATLKLEYRTSMKAIKKYRNARDYDNALKEISNLQNTLSKYENLIRNTPNSLGAVAIGDFIATSITCIKQWITTVLTSMAVSQVGRKINDNIYDKSDNLVLGANGAVLNKRMVTNKDVDIAAKAATMIVTCKSLIDEFSEPLNKIKNGENLEYADFNLYRNICLKQVGNIKKQIESTKKLIIEEKKNFVSLAKLAKESSYIEMADPKECAENVPFHEYYISDYYSEALKDIDPQTKASMISMAAMVTAMAGSIVIGRKLSASHKKKLQKMFKLYEQNHPDVIPASSFEYGLYSEDEASDMKVRTKYSTASMSTKYHIYTDKKNKPFMYIIFSFKRVGSVTYNRTDGGFSSGLVSTSRDEDVIHPECDLILVSPLAKKHPTYYRAYMAYKAGIGHDALNRFIDTMKTELKKSKNTFKESAYNMILEDTEFDGFEEYLESTDDSLFFDEFYKEANEIV